MSRGNGDVVLEMLRYKATIQGYDTKATIQGATMCLCCTSASLVGWAAVMYRSLLTASNPASNLGLMAA